MDIQTTYLGVFFFFLYENTLKPRPLGARYELELQNEQCSTKLCNLSGLPMVSEGRFSHALGCYQAGRSRHPTRTSEHAPLWVGGTLLCSSNCKGAQAAATLEAIG